MGCPQSKIENEETVNRCKEQKHHLERAVTARNKFAAAHTGHAMSLKNTGAALSDFAQGEVWPPFLPFSVPAGARLPRPVPPVEILAPPPPPFNDSTPLQRSATMPEIAIPGPDNKHSDPIIEEENENDLDEENSHSLKRRSSKARSSRGGTSAPEVIGDPAKIDQRSRHQKLQRQPQLHSHPPEGKVVWDYFFEVGDMTGPTLAAEENIVEREEIERKMLEERARAKAREMEAKVEKEPPEMIDELPPQPPPPEEAIVPPPNVVKRVKQDVPAEGKKKGGGSSLRLMQIFVELDDCFLKASESAHDVSRMLEATRLHYHSNFADKRRHINHSERVMRVITWNRSFRGLPTQEDGVDDFDSEEQETHVTVLDKMLAWEKKLYDEVKAGEQMKL